MILNTIVIGALVALGLSGCARSPRPEPSETPVPRGALEVGAFRVGTAHETEDLEAALAALFALRHPSKTVVIYDASGSMRWPMAVGATTPRFEPGQRGITAYLRQANAADDFALIAFGHRLPPGKPGSLERRQSCRDIEEILPLGRLDRERMIGTITSLRWKDHRGDTPLEDSVRVATEVLRDQPGTKKIILVTDGNDECDGRPDRAARAASKSGIRVYAIAFGVGITKQGERDEERAAEIRRILIDSANAGGGLVFEADDAQELYRALMRVELAMFTYAVQDAAGHTVVTGQIAETVSVAPGNYRIVFNTEKPFSDSVEIQSGLKTKVLIALSPAGVPELRKAFE